MKLIVVCCHLWIVLTILAIFSLLLEFNNASTAITTEPKCFIKTIGNDWVMPCLNHHYHGSQLLHKKSGKKLCCCTVSIRVNQCLPYQCHHVHLLHKNKKLVSVSTDSFITATTVSCGIKNWGMQFSCLFQKPHNTTIVTANAARHQWKIKEYNWPTSFKVLITLPQWQSMLNATLEKAT